jgi:hypothetical protein
MWTLRVIDRPSRDLLPRDPDVRAVERGDDLRDAPGIHPRLAEQRDERRTGWVRADPLLHGRALR